MKEKFPNCQLVLDMEQVADTSAGNPEQRRRRLKFYWPTKKRLVLENFAGNINFVIIFIKA
ncbi:hypothetical protein [Phocaeicola faecalis]|uniref:hypothetical protein n=1 Tax=Phocaeicola faecalis TaxID=2786956 RepID=UPI001F25E750|nr:hypothetical protein [Phocaeicola faecalis]